MRLLKMLKLKFKNKIILGLDKVNIKRLTEGQPIHIKARELKLEDDIFIVYGATLKDIAKELEVEHLLDEFDFDGDQITKLDLSEEEKN